METAIIDIKTDLARVKRSVIYIDGCEYDDAAFRAYIIASIQDRSNVYQHTVNSVDFKRFAIVSSLAACLSGPMMQANTSNSASNANLFEYQTSHSYAQNSLGLITDAPDYNNILKGLKKKNPLEPDPLKIKNLESKLNEFLVKKDRSNYFDKASIGNSIHQIFNEVSKIKYEKFTIELTTYEVLNITLLIKDKKFVRMGFPLVNNIEGLPSGNVLYTYLENSKIKGSANTTVERLAEKVNIINF